MKVQDQDVRCLAGFGIVGFLVLVLFFGFLRWGPNLPQLPDLDAALGTSDGHFDALAYRERRGVFALTLRAFITGRSVIVGRALCTRGGIFILRQVTAAAGAVRLQFAFARRRLSPGGVTIMALTQWLAVPIRAIEVIPSGSLALCQTEEGGEMQLCEAIPAEGEGESAGAGAGAGVGAGVAGPDPDGPAAISTTLEPPLLAEAP